jgi:hypothetical protein
MDKSNFKLTLDKIISWANISVNKGDGQVLHQIIIRIFDAAVEDDPSAELCAKLCQRLMENFLGKAQYIHITDDGQNAAHSYQLFRFNQLAF